MDLSGTLRCRRRLGVGSAPVRVSAEHAVVGFGWHVLHPAYLVGEYDFLFVQVLVGGNAVSGRHLVGSNDKGVRPSTDPALLSQ